MKNNRIMKISTGKIIPNKSQPRKYFNEQEIASLSASIKENGLLQPITVRECADGHYEIVAGERRLRAARMAGIEKIDCIVIQASAQQSAALALVENLQRQGLDCFEEAEGYARLIVEWGISQTQVAEKFGIAQSTLANKLRLLKLTEHERARTKDGNLTERHVRALIKIEDVAQREILIERIIRQKLTVAQTENLIFRTLHQEKRQKPKLIQGIRDIRIFYNSIEKAIKSMRLSGIDAEERKSETEEYTEYVIRIPKNVG